MSLSSTEAETVGKFCFLYSRFERFLLDHGCFDIKSYGAKKLLAPSFDKFHQSGFFKKVTVADFDELTKPLNRNEWLEARATEEWVEAFPDGLDGLLLWKKIRQVRNNLFHGSKALLDKERDMALIRESLVALERFSKLEYEFSKYV